MRRRVFVGFAGFFVETNFLDGGRQLAADGDQQIFFAAGIFVLDMAAQSHHADGAVLAPEQHPVPCAVAVGADEIRDCAGEMRKIFGGDHFGARAHDKVAKAIGKTDFGRAGFIAAARSPGGAAAIGRGIGIGKIDGSALRAEQAKLPAARSG